MPWMLPIQYQITHAQKHAQPDGRQLHDGILADEQEHRHEGEGKGQQVEADADGNRVVGVDVGEQTAERAQSEQHRRLRGGRDSGFHAGDGGHPADPGGDEKMGLEIRHRLPVSPCLIKPGNYPPFAGAWAKPNRPFGAKNSVLGEYFTV